MFRLSHFSCPHLEFKVFKTQPTPFPVYLFSLGFGSRHTRINISIKLFIVIKLPSLQFLSGYVKALK